MTKDKGKNIPINMLRCKKMLDDFNLVKLAKGNLDLKKDKLFLSNHYVTLHYNSKMFSVAN